jgi:hypothetical protein
VGPGVFIPIYSTHPLSSGSQTATRAVIVIHGTGRNADGYFQHMLIATPMESTFEETVVIAPHFQLAEDSPGPNEVYWTDSGWKRGHLSVAAGPKPRVSSYEALDAIVRLLGVSSRFPQLRKIVVTGHSAGGQVVHRYAAGSPVEDEFPQIDFGYVVANPSTYLYLGPERWDGAGFTLPNVAACPNYDQWHYGLTDLNSYMSRPALSEIRDRLVRRNVSILVGSADTGVEDLDVSCGAYLQGENRFERGRKLVDFMDATRPAHHHLESIVPGIGHSGRAMYTSPAGRQAVFGG